MPVRAHSAHSASVHLLKTRLSGVSDYRGTRNPQVSNMMGTNTVSSSPKVTYSSMIQQDKFPTNEQAIVFEDIEGLTVQNYTTGLGSLIGKEHVRFVSRTSHRIVVYLDSKELADKLTENNTKVNIGSHSLLIRPLITKSKRIIISNVCPIIPHTHIENELAKLNITPASKILFIRAGITEPGYSHVLSFRRQVYIQPGDEDKLPSSLKISYDNSTYWIYFSTQKIVCFLCKEEGHLARYCKNVESYAPNSQSEPNPIAPNVAERPASVVDQSTNSTSGVDQSTNAAPVVDQPTNSASVVINNTDLMPPP